MPEPISLESFQNHLSSRFRLDAHLLKSHASLIYDLGFDSVQMMELLLSVESLGVYLDENVFGQIETVGDLYSAYVAAVVGPSPMQT